MAAVGEPTAAGASTLPTTRDNVSCSRTAATKDDVGGEDGRVDCWLLDHCLARSYSTGNSTLSPSSPGPVTTSKGWDLQTLSCLLTPLSSEGMEANE